MSDERDPETMGHEYDGIQEFDNPLPTWWLVTFLATIIFGFHYWIHYEFGGGTTQYQELASDLAKIPQTASASGPTESEDDLVKAAGVAGTLEKGAAVYAGKCAVCHGAELEGTIGPNLADKFWIHGKGKLSDIAAVVRAGVPAKGMPNWEGLLPPDEIVAVVAFIGSRKGAAQKNPKAPQGEPVAD